MGKSDLGDWRTQSKIVETTTYFAYNLYSFGSVVNRFVWMKKTFPFCHPFNLVDLSASAQDDSIRITGQ